MVILYWLWITYLPNLSSEELLMDEGRVSKGVLGGHLHAVIEPGRHHQHVGALEEHCLASINSTWQIKTNTRSVRITCFQTKAAGEHALAYTTPARWSAYSIWRDGWMVCMHTCAYSTVFPQIWTSPWIAIVPHLRAHSMTNSITTLHTCIVALPQIASTAKSS